MKTILYLYFIMYVSVLYVAPAVAAVSQSGIEKSVLKNKDIDESKYNEESASPWAYTQQGDVRLISTVVGIGNNSSVLVGLQFRLRPHWKIYWRTPGDAGYPPTIDWSGSKNLHNATIAWPAPHRFNAQGITVIGYENEIIFPITIMLEVPGTPLLIQASVNFLACSTICVPQRVQCVLFIRSGPEESSPFTRIVEHYASRVPRDDKSTGLRLTSATTQIDRNSGGGLIEIEIDADSALDEPDLFIEGFQNQKFSIPKIRKTRNEHHIIALIQTEMPIPEGTSVTLTVVDNTHALQISTPLARYSEKNDDSTRLLTTWSGEARTIPQQGKPLLISMLASAFLGGLILNLMPCVLPVLWLKIFTLAKYDATTHQKTIRQDCLASAFGVLVAFLLLASMAVFVKSMSRTFLGWGIQFQEPLFLVIMVITLTLFVANLWGSFEISLPPRVNDFLVKFGYKHAGSFITGIVTTLLATPCSAPFLGTAVGFALSRGTLEVFLIFTFLATGMASPYLMLAAFPSFSVRLPKPGPWMIKTKRALGVILLVTTVWLLTVLAKQIDPITVFSISIILAIALVLLVLRRYSSSLILQSGIILLVLVFFGSAITAVQISRSTEGRYKDNRETVVQKNTWWLPFDERSIETYLAEGRIVFVYVTADWCITCQLNEATMLSSQVVREYLRNKTVTMKADWTKADATISVYLAKFGRYGVPFSVIYGPCASQGLPLPELLTVKALVEALDTASRSCLPSPP